MGNVTRARIDALINDIVKYVPPMGPYFRCGLPLQDYSLTLKRHGAHSAHRTRRQSLARAVSETLTSGRGPNGKTMPMVSSLEAVNIVDHHQLLNHPLLLGTNVIANADGIMSATTRRPVVVFSCSNVSPTNAYMRSGFQFAGQSIPYFSAREGHDAIYFTPPREFDFVERLRTLKRWRRFTPSQQAFLGAYQTHLNSLDYSQARSHRDQLSIAVQETWPHLFDPELRRGLPDLLYANAEDVARQALMELLPTSNVISEMLFEPGLRNQVLEDLRGNVVAWDEAAGRGTHFFWRRRPDSNRLLRLFIRGSRLVPADQRFEQHSLPLTPDSVCDHLHREEIIPSVFLWVTLLLYCGVTPLVGPGSLVYTEQLRYGLMSLLGKAGHRDESSLLGAVETGGLIAGAPIFFARESGAVKTLYGADIICRGGMSSDYMRRLMKVPLQDLLAVGATGVYSLFENSYIPSNGQQNIEIDYDKAATAIHEWIEV